MNPSLIITHNSDFFNYGRAFFAGSPLPVFVKPQFAAFNFRGGITRARFLLAICIYMLVRKMQIVFFIDFPDKKTLHDFAA